MHSLARYISLVGRKRHSEKDRRRVLSRFAEWRIAQEKLPAARPREKTLLLIRLDDIGDYLLFRNQLGVYKTSARWKDYQVTLLANESWRSLFSLLDEATVDAAIWVHKNRYLEDATYRFDIWRNLRERRFETVIAASRTRPLLLDDFCMLAAAPLHSMGSVNTNVHADWNRLSDGLYASLFNASRGLMHEYEFNALFAQWACGASYRGARPYIEHRSQTPERDTYTLCFVGASTRSKRWPARRWIEFIELHRRCLTGTLIICAGSGEAELEAVRLIQERTRVESVAGKLTLAEVLDWIAGAQAVVTNDTMAAHMGAALNTPTVIVANGLNYMRFSEYGNAGIDGVTAVYPDVFNRRRKRVGDTLYAYHETVTADIASIRAADVIEALQKLLSKRG